MRPRAFVAAVGDANDPVTWSGTPYHFLCAARTAGLMDEGLPLSTAEWSWKARRAGWNALQAARGERLGGYQYSPAFLERLWAPVRDRLRHAVVVNCFQLYAPSVVKDATIERWFFIDQTLLQMFDHYQLRSTVGRTIVAEALEREREGYQAAAGIITHSGWAARSVVADYGAAPEKVHVVVPGANLDAVEYGRWLEGGATRTSGGPLRLVFVGKDWHRKGLDRLLRALALARADGLDVTLRVIGCPKENLPPALQAVPGVEWFGFLDKRREAARFLRAISECDIGCAPSRAEAGGMAIREYHALGLIVLGTDAGGAPEHMLRQASVTVPVDASDREFATILLELARDRARFATLAAAARSSRHLASWDESIRQIREFWPHAGSGQTPLQAAGSIVR